MALIFKLFSSSLNLPIIITASTWKSARPLLNFWLFGAALNWGGALSGKFGIIIIITIIIVIIIIIIIIITIIRKFVNGYATHLFERPFFINCFL